MSIVLFQVNYLNANNVWKYLKSQFKQKSILSLQKKNKIKLSDDEKLYSFFKHSLLPPSISKKSDKFYILRNDKKVYINFGFGMSEHLSEHNEMVIEIIIAGFSIFYYALYNLSSFLEEYQLNENREVLCNSLYSISVLHNFQNMFLNEFFECDDNLQDLAKSFILDKTFYDTYINIFNFFLFNDLKLFEFLLNFEKYRYEEALILNNFDLKKAEKFKILIDYFNFDFLDMHNDFFNAICIYEFFISFTYLYFWFHDITFEFFSKIKVYEDDNPLFLKAVAKYDPSLFRYKTFLRRKNKIWNKYDLHSYFLVSTYFSFSTKFLKQFKKDSELNKKIFSLSQQSLHVKYKNLKFRENNKVLDFRNFILDFNSYSIKMPIIIFLLYSWYAIYYKRLRYNAYIGGAISYFNEKFSRLHYFIYLNNPRSSNLWKFSPLKYQKLNTVYHFKSYVELQLFNDQFLFYFALKSDLKKYINNNLVLFQNNFNLLNNNENIIQFFKIKSVICNNIISLFFNENLALYSLNYEMLEAYTLLMRAPLTKCKKLFSLGRLSFLEHDTLVETVFLFTAEKKALQFYMEDRMLYDYYVNIYINNLNTLFITDFYNFYNKQELLRLHKILTFFNKLIYIIFYLLDPFFFKYFWKRCFPTKWNKLWVIYDFVWTNLFMIKFLYGVENFGVLEFNITKYSFFMFFLNWRIDTSSSVGMNYWSSDIIGYNFIIINEMYKNRFFVLLKQMQFLIKLNGIKNKQQYLYLYYLLNLKNYYYDLLYLNIEYGLIFFFNNISKFLKLVWLYNNNPIKEIIFFNFIYRYYASVVLFQNHYYDDWYYDWTKRILMTYLDNFHKHEGKFFYSKKGDVI